ncbi:MAG: FMN-binding protein [Actinomycetota bacterium]|nr:FMN-binding protein [Actinomycetota bacterium]MDH4353479.1 FMN-binding protein [Actinomycetota bacterium]
MKRAVFVTAGTVAGLVASFSYTPGLLPGLLDGGGGAANAAAKQTKGSKPDTASGTSPQKSGHQGAKKTKPKAGGKDGSSGQGGGSSKAGTATSGGGAGDGGSPTTGSGGTTSSGTSGTTSGSKPQPKPTKSTTSTKPTPKPSPPAQPRTYAGSVVSTAFGPMQVSITVLDGRITDAKALQFPSADPKSVEIAKAALPKLRSETLSAQSASIAVVSGATYTSKGWISSLQSALSKAGL